MSNIIDSLIVTIGLDPSDFVKGAKNTDEALKKTRESAVKTGSVIEESTKKNSESFVSLTRQAITFFAVLAGAKSVTDFTAKIIGGDAALGRLATTLGVLPSDLAAVTQAVERNGGSADTAAKSFRGLSDAFEDIKVNGDDAIIPMLQKLQGAGGKSIDIFHGFAAALPGIAENLKAIKDAGNNAQADYMARSLGIDPETAIFLEQGWAKVSQEIEKSKKLGVPDKNWTDASQQIQKSYEEARQAAHGLGREIVEYLVPAVKDSLVIIKGIFTGSFKEINSGFHDLTEDMIHYLEDFRYASNDLYHYLTGKYLIPPRPAAGASGGAAAGGGTPFSEDNRLPGSGGFGLRRRSAETKLGGRRGFMTRTFDQKAPNVATRLKADFDLSDEDAAAMLGNFGHESAGFTAFAEGGGGPGRGWPMWTSRDRKEGFYRYAQEHNLDPTSDEANYGYIKQELSTTYASAIRALKNAKGLENKTIAFEQSYEGAGIKAYGSRIAYAKRALNLIHGQAAPAKPVVPAPAPGTFDPKTGATLIPHASLAPNAKQVYGDLSGAYAAFHQTSVNHAVNSSNHEVNIGNVTVNTQATDGEGIAKSIKPALERHSFAIQANSGPF